MDRIKKFFKSEKGSMIETMVVLPIIISLLWGGFQSGLFLYTKVQLQEAKRTGLKQMEIHGGMNTHVYQSILNEFNDNAIDISSLQINGTPGPQNYGTELLLNLKLNYEIRLFTPFGGPSLYTHTLDITDHITSEYIIR